MVTANHIDVGVLDTVAPMAITLTIPIQDAVAPGRHSAALFSVGPSSFIEFVGGQELHFWLFIGSKLNGDFLFALDIGQLVVFEELSDHVFFVVFVHTG